MTLPTSYQGTRLNYRTSAKEGYDKLIELQRVVEASGIDPLLFELIKIRTSQINGCAFCIDMHIKDALALGEKQERLNLLVVWRETSLFTEKEQAALAWTEAVTNISTTHISDELFNFMKENFTDQEIAYIDLAVIVINSWNRLALPFRDEPGKYVSRKGQKKSS